MAIQADIVESPRLAGAHVARWGVATAGRKTRSASNPAGRIGKCAYKFKPARRQAGSSGAKSVAASLAEQASAAEETFVEYARGPSQRALGCIDRLVKKWLNELLKACEVASATGAKKCVWDSEECFGFSRDAEAELTQRLAKGVAAYGFLRVDWWRGSVLGWTSEPGNRVVSDNMWSPQSAARPVPVGKRRVGAWDFAVRLRVSWAADDLPCEISKQLGACFVCQQPQRRSAKLHPCAHVLCRFCSRRLRGKPCPLCGTKCAIVEDVPMEASKADLRVDVAQATPIDETMGVILRRSQSSPDMCSKASEFLRAPVNSARDDVCHTSLTGIATSVFGGQKANASGMCLQYDSPQLSASRSSVVRQMPGSSFVAPPSENRITSAASPVQGSRSKLLLSSPPSACDSTQMAPHLCPEVATAVPSPKLGGKPTSANFTSSPSTSKELTPPSCLEEIAPTPPALAPPPNSSLQQPHPSLANSLLSPVQSPIASTVVSDPSPPSEKIILTVSKDVMPSPTPLDMQVPLPASGSTPSSPSKSAPAHSLNSAPSDTACTSAAAPLKSLEKLILAPPAEIVTAASNLSTSPLAMSHSTSPAILAPPTGVVRMQSSSTGPPPAPPQCPRLPETPNSSTVAPTLSTPAPSIPQSPCPKVSSVAPTPRAPPTESGPLHLAPSQIPTPPAPTSQPPCFLMAPKSSPAAPTPPAPIMECSTVLANTKICPPPAPPQCATKPPIPPAPQTIYPPPKHSPAAPSPPPAPPPLPKPPDSVPSAPLASLPIGESGSAIAEAGSSPTANAPPYPLTSKPSESALTPSERLASPARDPTPVLDVSNVQSVEDVALSAVITERHAAEDPMDVESVGKVSLAGARNRRSSVPTLPSGGAVLPRLQEEEEDETSGEAQIQRSRPPKLDFMEAPGADDDDDDGVYSAFEESGNIPSPMMACQTPVGNVPPIKLATTSPNALLGRHSAPGGEGGVQRERRSGAIGAGGGGGGTPVSARSSEANTPTILHLGIPGLRLSALQRAERNDDDDDHSYSAFEESAIGTPMASPTGQLQISHTMCMA